MRLPSGTTDLDVAVITVLLAGGAYAPVDADDPQERAALVFTEADVAAVVGAELVVETRRPDNQGSDGGSGAPPSSYAGELSC